MHTFRRVAVVLRNAVHVPIFKKFRVGPVRRLALAAGLDDRQPVPGVPIGTAPQISELDHYCAPMIGTFVASSRSDGTTSSL